MYHDTYQLTLCRCTRNCYDCPLCTSSLQINALDKQSKDHLSPADQSQPTGPFFLSCPYCDWSSLDAGIEFSRPTKLTEQLARMRKRLGRGDEQSAGLDESEVLSPPPAPKNRDAVFDNLAKFYRNQLQESDAAPSNPFSDNSYSSPNNLARIMQLYGGLSGAALKKSQEKPQPMREALSAQEGLIVLGPDHDNRAIAMLQEGGHNSTTTSEQRLSHPWNYEARFVSDLWPVPALLRTRRSKRCSTCRHILTRLDDRKGSSSSGGGTMKYKIRLLAQNHIPRVSLRLFTPGVSASTSIPSPAFALTMAALNANKESKEWDLQPGKTVQYLLTLTNPLFEPIKVSLATPSTTPGRVQSRVTVLCPSFDIGADGDMWDEALSSSAGSRSRAGAASKDTVGAEDRQPEAGKVWEKGRNWTSVVVEVVPGFLNQTVLAGMSKPKVDEQDDERSGDGHDRVREDEDVLEIPILVRMEWEAEVPNEEGAIVAPGVKANRESKELAFWSVLGAGRIQG